MVVAFTMAARPDARSLSSPLQNGWLFCSKQEQPPSPTRGPCEDEDNGVIEPFIKDLLLPDESDDLTPDESPAADIPMGELAEPLDPESDDEDDLGPTNTEAFAFNNAESGQDDADEEQGPQNKLEWDLLESMPSNELDEPEDGPVENHPSLELPPPTATEPDADDESSTPQIPGLEVDDANIAWAKEPWAELPTQSAFSARQALALVGSTLCVGGESSHLLCARTGRSIENAPIQDKTQRVLCLDSDAQRILLLTTTGQLLLWQRNSGLAPDQVRKIPIANDEIVSCIWQQAPGVPILLARLDSGRAVTWNDATETVVPATSPSDRTRLRALSQLGDPRVSLWQTSVGARLRVEFASSTSELTPIASMERALSDKAPMLVGFVDYVLFGARDYGLFVRGPTKAQFALVPGSRRLTALTVGRIMQRPTAFLGLFSELEDRAEIVTLDLLTGRANRVAELRIFADDAGPADDPPERARIDALLWDPNLMRLWVAGCFGLTSFSPPTTAVSS
jgi:hypothetical protein